MASFFCLPSFPQLIAGATQNSSLSCWKCHETFVWMLFLLPSTISVCALFERTNVRKKISAVASLLFKQCLLFLDSLSLSDPHSWRRKLKRSVFCHGNILTFFTRGITWKRSIIDREWMEWLHVRWFLSINSPMHVLCLDSHNRNDDRMSRNVYFYCCPPAQPPVEWVLREITAT